MLEVTELVGLRHTGLYVKDLDIETEFYKNVFGMHVVCENIIQNDMLTADILKQYIGENDLIITKLITDTGKKSGWGDMIELIQVKYDKFYSERIEDTSWHKCLLNKVGCMHLAFGVDDIYKCVNSILSNGGQQYTEIYQMQNGNKCCFCIDPEGNYIELIESAE